MLTTRSTGTICIDTNIIICDLNIKIFLLVPGGEFPVISSRSGVPLTQLLSPSVPPCYGVIFLREERPLTPEVLTHWAETLSQPLFGQPISCTLTQVPSRQEAMEQFENEMRLMR